MKKVHISLFLLSIMPQSSFSLEKENKARNIQMQEERIQIYLNNDGSVKTEVDFVFKGEMPKGFKMGFPENGTIIYQNFKASFGSIEMLVPHLPL